MNLYKHQVAGMEFLRTRKSAMLCFSMGTGKTRTALAAAVELYAWDEIDRIVVLAPAAVRYSWREELAKLLAEDESTTFILVEYDQKAKKFYANGTIGIPIVLISYALLHRPEHREAIARWAANGKTLLIADESSFLKNRTTGQAKGALEIAEACPYRWLLTGTPITNTPLDLWGQGLVMAAGAAGPLKGFKSFYQFQARYAILNTVKMGPRRTFNKVVGSQNIPELTKRFAPYVLRCEKRDCLDLPEKTYVTREVVLADATWKIYQELKKEAILALGDGEMVPEPNAAVRILRLAQITSGHVGVGPDTIPGEHPDRTAQRDVSSEKLSYLTEEILSGELANEKALIVWCRWRRERERLSEILSGKIAPLEIYGGQRQDIREAAISHFQNSVERRVLIAQQQAGGFGLNLTAASTAVYLSNTFSFTVRAQSEDRTHRIGQLNPTTYIDVVAVGPRGQKTIDHVILDALRAKKDLATLTTSAWRKALSDD